MTTTDETNLDIYGFSPADFDLHPDAVDLPDLSDQLPPRPPESGIGQDEEGLGGPPGDIEAFVRPTAEALAIVIGHIRAGDTCLVGRCLQYSRGYFNVYAKYLAAKDSLQGAIDLGVAHKIDLNNPNVKVPRGVLVYWRRIVDGVVVGYGHIAPSLGGGFVGSTDWPSGHYGRVNIVALAHAWAYTECYWAPVVNDVRVWKPKAKPKPTPLIDQFLAEQDYDKRTVLLTELAKKGDGDRPGQVKKAAQSILDGRADKANPKTHDKGAREIATGRQALRALSTS